MTAVDARGERHSDGALPLLQAAAATARARICDRGALAATGWARLREHDEAAPARDLTATVAGRAGLGLRARTRARSVAGAACDRRRERDLLLAAEHRFFER